LSYMQAAVVTSNLMYESKLNPFLKQEGGPAYGLAQWENYKNSPDGRQAQMIQRMRKELGENYAQAKIEDAILVQLAFMFDGENKEETRRVGQSRIRTATTIGDALFGFGRYYEAFDGSDNRDNMYASLTDTNIRGWKKRAVFTRDIIGLKYPDLKEQAEEAAGSGTTTPKGVPADIANYVLAANKNDSSINGKLDTTKLSKINTSVVSIKETVRNPYLHPKAAKQLEKLAKLVKDNNLTMTVSDAYRDYNTQVGLYSSLGRGKAAKPGNSNHGWGIAVDISELYQAAKGSISPEVNRNVRATNELYKFLDKHAAQFGFYNPDKLQDGKGVDEVWHWEYHEV
jgi:LAS superfamily LD-carboxypeptidase LdcB